MLAHHRGRRHAAACGHRKLSVCLTSALSIDRSRVKSPVPMPRPSAFTEDDRRILNQIPIKLENIKEKLGEIQDRTNALESRKADRGEVAEIEKRILDRLDILQEELE